MRQLRGSSKTAGEPAWELSPNRKDVFHKENVSQRYGRERVSVESLIDKIGWYRRAFGPCVQGGVCRRFCFPKGGIV